MYFVGYAILFVACMISGFCLFFFEKKPKVLKYISVFGGAFLLAVCFVHLLPEAFSGAGHEVCSHSHLHSHSDHEGHSSLLPMGAFVLLGFVLQLLLELLSKGAEHGHLHSEEHSEHKSGFVSALMVLVGVSIHAFLEGFALVIDGKMNYSLLLGVVLHNIPIAMVVAGSFLAAGCSKIASMCSLAVFAIMGVLGSLLGVHLDFVAEHTGQIMCFVVGILLHVSVSTLFDSSESHKYNFARFVTVVAAFVLACLLPH